MDTARRLRWSNPPETNTIPAPRDPREERVGAIASSDAVQLARLIHDLRSPLTVLTCNRRFLEELLAQRGIDSSELREIFEDDAIALARLERAVAMLSTLSRSGP